MSVYSRIAVVGLMLVAVATASCGRRDDDWRREQTEELKQYIRESLADFREGVREGFNDSTVVVMLGDSAVSATAKGRSGGNISLTMTISDDSDADAAGLTAINIVTPDSARPEAPEDVPAFVGEVAICGIIFLFGGPVVAVFLICYFIYRTKRARYRAMADIVAAGKDVPQELLPQSKPNYKWDSGVRYVAWGAALMLFFLIGGFTRWAMLMLVPIIIGASKLWAYRREQRLAADSGDDGGNPGNSGGSANSGNIPPTAPHC